MVMCESEIVREYRTAKNKPKQIAVLAELNAVKADWIKDMSYARCIRAGTSARTPGDS